MVREVVGGSVSHFLVAQRDFVELILRVVRKCGGGWMGRLKERKTCRSGDSSLGESFRACVCVEMIPLIAFLFDA